MPKTTKRPALRFAGFSGEWEERKLGDIGKARSGVGFPDVEQGGTEGIPFYKVSDMNLVGNEIEMTRSNNYVTNEQIEKKRWNPVDDVPAIFFAKVGAAVMLNRKRLCRFPFLLDNNTMAYSLYNDYWNMEFAKAAFTKIDFTKLIQVGALPSYNSGDVEDIRVMLPPMKEQNKIGQYFAHLDHLIALHERKYSKLMNVKKFMLEKMFPKDGAKVPALRFAGFSSEWEERKLEEIGTIVTGSTPSTDISEYYSSDGIPWVTPTDILENITYNTTKKLSDKGQKVGRIVPPNSILVTCIASIGKNTMLGTVGSCNQQINGCW